MKKLLYILAAGLFSFLAACNKDDSTSATKPIPDAIVSGLQENYTVFSHQDFLRLAPTVQNENDFDFYWTLFFAGDFTAGQGLVKADTIGRTKDLDYEVLNDPGPYILVFNVRDKKTGVTKQIDIPLNVSTVNMHGWYLVKDNGGNTDMDFIYPENDGRIDNWISFYNGGRSLSGNAVKAVFVPAFKESLTSQKTFNTLMVLSENDAAIYRIDNGAMVMNFDNMFFSRPATRKPQAVFQTVAQTDLGFINDGRPYYMRKGTLFSLMPSANGGISYTNISPITAVAAAGIGFNNSTKSVFCYNGANFTELNNNDKGGKPLKNMNADIEWMAGYAGSRSVAMMLFRNPQDTGYLFRLNGATGQLLYGSDGLVTAQDTLKPEHTLMHADIIAGNYDVDFIYYAVGNKIYLTDVASLQEDLQFTLPADETVTCIQHIKYPQPVTGAVNTLNYLAIATYKAGHYKVYLHTISTTGTIQALPQANFEGEGRVSTIIYMEQGNGSRVF